LKCAKLIGSSLITTSSVTASSVERGAWAVCHHTPHHTSIRRT